MQFDFETCAALVPETQDTEFTREIIVGRFRCYFQTYEDAFGRAHPPIRREQIKRITAAIPNVTDAAGRDLYVTPECYPAMISRHFHTDYREGCDYNINHFFAGRIRELRLFETCF